MKIISIVFFFLTAALVAEDVVISTPYGDKTVIIPTSQADLKKNYIQLSTMYFSQKYDLEITLAKLKEVNEQLGVSTERILNTTNALKKTETVLDTTLAEYKDIFSKYQRLNDSLAFKSMIGLTFSFNAEKVEYGVTYFGVISQIIYVGAEIKFPLEIGAFLGIQL